MEEDEEEVDGEVDVGEDSSTGELVPKQALVPQATILVAPESWAAKQSDQVGRRGLATSSRAWDKMPAVQVELLPLAKIDKKLTRPLQAEELAVEEAHQGRDMATLEVVMEAASC